jgi:pyruvate dehydrogenase E1 component alpha subunit
LDFASLHSLPALFVCENNEFSVYSHIKKRQAKKRNILKIAKALGINSTKLPGDDVTKIYNLSAKIIKNIKKNSKPHLIIIDTFRHLEHCGPNNDDHLAYRSKTYIKKWLNNDPLKKIEKKFLTSNCMSNNDLNTIKIKIEKEISSAFQFAESSKFPSKRLLLQDIYAD